MISNSLGAQYGIYCGTVTEKNRDGEIFFHCQDGGPDHFSIVTFGIDYPNRFFLHPIGDIAQNRLGHAQS